MSVKAPSGFRVLPKPSPSEAPPPTSPGVVNTPESMSQIPPSSLERIAAATKKFPNRSAVPPVKGTEQAVSSIDTEEALQRDTIEAETSEAGSILNIQLMPFSTRAVPTVEGRETTLSETDERYESVSLPSLFQPYSYDMLSIRPLGVQGLKRLYLARQKMSPRLLGEAVGHCIDRSPFELTVGDFWYLMYWLRINSYPKAPYEIRWTCMEDEHLQAVQKREKTGASLNNVEVITRTKITQKNLDAEACLKLIEDAAEMGMSLSIPTFGDFVHSSEIRAELNDALSPDDEWMLPFASCLDKTHGETLIDRFRWLTEEGSPDMMFILEKFMQTSDHGVIEKVNAKCTGCGKSTELPMSVDLLSFFPGV